MNVNMNTMANQEMVLNRAQVGSDILQKTLEKTEQSRANNQSAERPETGRVTKGQGRLINIYA